MARTPRSIPDPFALLQSEINRLFEDALRGWELAEPRRRGAAGTVFSPRVDVYELPNELVVKVDLPGVDANQIDLNVEEGALVIRGERSEEDPGEQAAWHARERWQGRFGRVVPLPSQVDVDGITAQLKNGVLLVRLPKKTAPTGRQIKIQAG